VSDYAALSRPAPLPVWPLVLMFGLVPVWWLTGAFYLAWPVFGLLLAGLLAARGAVRLPTGAPAWLLFCAIAALSLVEVVRVTEVATALLRLSFYLTALVVGIYAYTLARERGMRVLWLPLMLFWASLVALGWVGVLAPGLSLTTPVERLLPHGLAAAPYVHDMVHASGAELRADGVSTLRPSAPFPYTNLWGSCFAILLPAVLAAVSGSRVPGVAPIRPGWPRRLLILSVPLALPPAFLTLNRGMFVSLGIGLVFVALRAVRRGRPRLLATIAVLGVAAVALTWFIPIDTLIAARTETSDSTADRLSLYGEVLHRIVDSPLLGFGAPTTVDTTSAPAPVGTQGQLWMVLYSNGIPALAVFLGWFLLMVRAGLRLTSPAGLWLSAVPLIALVQLPFYGLNYQNLSVLFLVAGAIAAAAGPRDRGIVVERGAPRQPVLVGPR
jgi:hypothetical protein